MKIRSAWIVALLVLVLACLAAWWSARAAFLAAYLAAWWFCLGLVMGGLANVWVHNLTGGAWGEAIRVPLLALARRMWLLALLFLPLLLGMHDLYAWTAGEGVARWAGELPEKDAAFKSMWLSPGFFIARSLGYLALWSLLAWLSGRASLTRSPRFAAAALILYGLSVSLAAVDWIMSLMPLWYSSAFGLLTGTGQMLTGMALAVLLVARADPRVRAPAIVLRDLGNLLLMYVMTWAYLAFTQFLIIWAENLPHEIVWYVARMHGGWLGVAWLLGLFHFFVPLLILLFRDAKEAPALLGALAAGLLAAHLLDVWWMILPSLEVGWMQWLWTVPLASATLGGAVWLALRAQVAKEAQRA